MTIVSSRVIIKKYVLNKVHEIMTNDQTLPSVAPGNNIMLGIPEFDLIGLAVSQYPFVNVLPTGNDNEDYDAAPNEVDIIQRISITFGVVQPTGDLLLSATVTAYDVEQLIKASFDQTTSRRLIAFSAGVSPNPTWASVETFDWGSTNQIISEPKDNRSIWEVEMLVRHQETRTRTGRIPVIYWDDGS